MEVMGLKQGYKLFHDGILALSRAEAVGIRFDEEYAQRTEQELTEKINFLEREFKQTPFAKEWARTTPGGLNINSNPSLSKYLYSVLKLPPVKQTEKGGGSTDDEALKALNIPELNTLLEIRKWLKVRDTYFAQFIRECVDGRIHPSFNLHTVTTYRSSSSNPNFQNIPKRDKEVKNIVRGALFPSRGNLLMEVDFSGLEVMIAACYHKDSVMLRYLTDPESDMHGDMCAQIFKIKNFNRKLPEFSYLRSATKNGFVFPQFYGDYYKNNAVSLSQWCNIPARKFKPGEGVKMPNSGTISDHLISVGVTTYSKFEEHLREVEYDFWNNRFKVYGQWKEKWYSDYQNKGYFDSLTGFRYRGLMRRNEVINYPVQGAAFHCLLWSFIQMDKAIYSRGLKSRLIGQIHDSMVLDVVPEELNLIQNLVRRITTVNLQKTWDWIIVPLNVEIEVGGIDCSWATLK